MDFLQQFQLEAPRLGPNMTNLEEESLSLSSFVHALLLTIWEAILTYSDYEALEHGIGLHCSQNP